MTAFFYAEGGAQNLTICNNDMSFSPVQANMFDGLIVLSGSNASAGRAQIYNNTLVNIGTNAMSEGMDLRGGWPNVTFRNNIVYGMTYPLYIEDSGSTVGLVSDNNLWSGTSGNLIYGGTFQSYSTWKAAGRDTNGSLGTTPSFVGAPGNVRLNSGSPGIGLGGNLTSLGITALTSDITGAARPSSGAWDAGAYQSSSGGGSVTVLPPTNLAVTVR
jgi:hypothetical protein